MGGCRATWEGVVPRGRVSCHVGGCRATWEGVMPRGRVSSERVVTGISDVIIEELVTSSWRDCDVIIARLATS